MWIQSNNSFDFIPCWAIPWQWSTLDPGDAKFQHPLPCGKGISTADVLHGFSKSSWMEYLYAADQRRTYLDRALLVIKMSLLSGGLVQTLGFFICPELTQPWENIAVLQIYFVWILNLFLCYLVSTKQVLLVRSGHLVSKAASLQQFVWLLCLVPV